MTFKVPQRPIHQKPAMTALEELREKVTSGAATPYGPEWHNALSVMWHTASEAFSGSLDAAKALHEALLPGWHLMLEDCRPDDLATVQIGSFVSLDTGLEGDMPISRLWLLAILDVLIQKEADHADDQ